MRHFMLALVVLVSGCHKGYVSAENTHEAVEIVLERHDAYVAADPSLDDAKRASYLRTSELLRTAYAEARKD